MKVWFFVEGESEVNCIVQLIKKFYPIFSVTTNPSEYINSIQETGKHFLYINDCGNVERIPHEINDQYHNVVSGNTDMIVIFAILKVI